MQAAVTGSDGSSGVQKCPSGSQFLALLFSDQTTPSIWDTVKPKSRFGAPFPTPPTPPLVLLSVGAVGGAPSPGRACCKRGGGDQSQRDPHSCHRVSRPCCPPGAPAAGLRAAVPGQASTAGDAQPGLVSHQRRWGLSSQAFFSFCPPFIFFSPLLFPFPPPPAPQPDLEDNQVL